MRSSTETLIAAMRILARDIRSTDGVANAAIREAADRLEELQRGIKCMETWARFHIDSPDDHAMALILIANKADQLLGKETQ